MGISKFKTWGVLDTGRLKLSFIAWTIIICPKAWRGWVIQQVYFAHDILHINVYLVKYVERLAQVSTHISAFQPDLIMGLLLKLLGEDDDVIMKKIILWIVSQIQWTRNIDINVYFFIKKKLRRAWKNIILQFLFQMIDENLDIGEIHLSCYWQ